MPFPMAEQKVLIAVAPNGARRSRKDHPALPVTPDELAETAAACAQAGAAMIHLHIRDEHGEHSLDPVRYRQAITAVRKRVGDSMLIQVSSEATGRFTVREQVAAMEELAPDCVSLGLREYIRDDASIEPGAGFLQRLYRSHALIQYILYSPDEVRWYEQLCEQGSSRVIFTCCCSCLGAMGRSRRDPVSLRATLTLYKDLRRGWYARLDLRNCR